MKQPITTFCALSFAALTVAACGSSENARLAKERNPAPCPNVAVLEDVSRMVAFEGDSTLENVSWTGEVLDVTTSCRYFGDKPIEADISIDFAFGKGPKASGNALDVTYFVAVTRTNEDLIQKQEFSVPVRFGKNEDIARVREKISKIVIPRANDGVSGTNFEIVVGLSLTKQQVIYNRSGKSLKFPNL